MQAWNAKAAEHEALGDCWNRGYAAGLRIAADHLLLETLT